MEVAGLLDRDFATLSDLIAAWARERSDHLALVQGEDRLTYAELDRLVDRIALALQRDGVQPHEAVAVCATTSINYAALFLGILRAGAATAPLAPSSTPESLAAMVTDCGARLLFLDGGVGKALAPVADRIVAARVALDGSDAGQRFEAWLVSDDARAQPVKVGPEDPFNIIYSSGTTGTPKASCSPTPCAGDRCAAAYTGRMR